MFQMKAKCTRKFVASCGELFSSSSNRYKITIPRHELLTLYQGDGVKTILLTLLTQFPDNYQVDDYIRLSDERKAKVSPKGLVKALYSIHVWREKKFEGECPPIKWKRSTKTFWNIVNARKEDSREKIMKTYFGVKLHPCRYCMEFDEEIAIYETLLKAHEMEKDDDLKAEMKKKIRSMEPENSSVAAAQR